MMPIISSRIAHHSVTQPITCMVTGLANGTIGTYHSLSYAQEMSQVDIVAFETALANAEPGEILLLRLRPHKVFIEVKMNVNHVQFPEQWCLSRTPDHVIVPIGLCHAPTGPTSQGCITIVAEPLQQIPGFTLGHHGFRCEPLLACTYNKIQGQTVKRVILQLNKRHRNRLSYEALYVGLSRVDAWDSWRIAPLHAGYSLDWLANLAPHPGYALWRASLVNGKFNLDKCRTEAALLGLNDQPAVKERKTMFEFTGKAKVTTPKKPGRPRQPRTPSKPKAKTTSTVTSPTQPLTGSTGKPRRAPAGGAPPRAPPPPLTLDERQEHYNTKIDQALARANVEAWNAQSLERPRATASVPAAYVRDVYALPNMQLLAHLIPPLPAPNAATAPCIMYTGEWADHLVTNTCNLDAQLYSLHMVLCTHARLLQRITSLADGVLTPTLQSQHPTVADQTVAIGIAMGLKRFHEFFHAKKFAAGRLAVVDVLLKFGLYQYPQGLNEKINLFTDLQLGTLLHRMDRSLTLAGFETRRTCDQGPACTEGNYHADSTLQFTSIGVRGCARRHDFVQELTERLNVPALNVPCQEAQNPLNLQINPAGCQGTVRQVTTLTHAHCPELLTIALGLRVDDRQFFRASDLPSVYRLETADHPVTYRLCNVTSYNLSNHFEGVIYLNPGANAVAFRYDAREQHRLRPYDPNDRTNFKPTTAWYIKE